MATVHQPRDDAVEAWAGRWFCRFAVQNRLHCVPVDEPEEELSDELNRIMRELLGSSIIAPLRVRDIDNPAFLDCGSGKATWIDEMLSEHGDVEITGVDIFFGSGNGSDGSDEDDEDTNTDAIEEYIKKRWNMNAPFRLDRSETRLQPGSFDMINSRFLTDGINADRWPGYVQELRQLLVPGGWVQMIEFHMLFQSNSGRDVRFLQNWYAWYADTLERMGKNPRVGSQLGRYMTAAGLAQVNYRPVMLPIGDWNREQRHLGRSTRALFAKLIRSWSCWTFTRAPGRMPPADYTAMINGATAELNNDSLQLYINVYAEELVQNRTCADLETDMYALVDDHERNGPQGPKEWMSCAWRGS